MSPCSYHPGPILGYNKKLDLWERRWEPPQIQQNENWFQLCIKEKEVLYRETELAIWLSVSVWSFIQSPSVDQRWAIHYHEHWTFPGVFLLKTVPCSGPFRNQKSFSSKDVKMSVVATWVNLNLPKIASSRQDPFIYLFILGGFSWKFFFFFILKYSFF